MDFRSRPRDPLRRLGSMEGAAAQAGTGFAAHPRGRQRARRERPGVYGGGRDGSRIKRTNPSLLRLRADRGVPLTAAKFFL